jgi:hypothetical protein
MRYVSIPTATILLLFTAPALADQASYIQDMRDRGYSNIPEETLRAIGAYTCDRDSVDTINGIYDTIASSGNLSTGSSQARALNLADAFYDSTRSHLCPSSQNIEVPVRVSISSGKVPVGSRPSVESDVWGWANNGQTGVMREISGNWRYVFFPSSDNPWGGWVYKTMVQVVGN